jgi:hypothetical protein
MDIYKSVKLESEMSIVFDVAQNKGKKQLYKIFTKKWDLGVTRVSGKVNSGLEQKSH